MKRWPLLLAAAGLLAAAACDVDPVERNNAGNTLYAQGSYGQALEAYQAAMVANPDRPEAYYNAASALARSGRQQAAIEALRQALRTADAPVIQAAYYNLGNVYFEAARYDEAAAAYRQALRLDPRDGDARFNYELALLRQASATPPPEDAEQATPTPTADPEQPPEAGTPTPTAGSNPDDAQTPTAQAGAQTPPPGAAGEANAETQGGGLTMEEAARSLDAVLQSQRTLREILQGQRTPQPPPAKDW